MAKDMKHGQKIRTPRRKVKHTKLCKIQPIGGTFPALRPLLCPVKWPASSLLVLNWYYLSVGLTITSWTDVSMAVISPIEGCAIGHPGTAAAWANRGHPRVSRKQYIWNRKFSLLCQMTKCLFKNGKPNINVIKNELLLLLLCVSKDGISPSPRLVCRRNQTLCNHAGKAECI